MDCSPAPGARTISNAPAVCSMSRLHPTMSPPTMQSPARSAHAAAAPWSSSRCSNADISLARRPSLNSHPGYRRRDPARPTNTNVQGRPAPGSRPACASAAHNRTSHDQSRHVCFSTSDIATYIKTVRSQMRPLLGSIPQPQVTLKTAFPIAQSMTPAVRAPPTFRRLPASETLNVSGRSGMRRRPSQS